MRCIFNNYLVGVPACLGRESRTCTAKNTQVCLVTAYRQGERERETERQRDYRKRQLDRSGFGSATDTVTNHTSSRWEVVWLCARRPAALVVRTIVVAAAAGVRMERLVH